MAAQSDGVYFDTTQLDRYFQESTGPTLADDVGEAIGLGLDQRTWGGQTLAEVLAAATEIRGTGTLALQGSATAATYDTGTGAGSASRVDFSNQSGVVFSGLSAGKTFALDITAPANLIIRDGSTLFGTALIGTLAGRYTYFVRIADASTAFCLTASAAGGTQAFTVHSIKLVPGKHALQSSASLRPLRQTGYSVGNNPELQTSNLSTFTLVQATYSGGVITVNSPDGSYAGSGKALSASVIGAVYKVEVNITSYVTGDPAAFFAGVQLSLPKRAGLHTVYLTAANTSGTLDIKRGSGATTFSYDYVSIKEVASTYLQAKFDGSDDNLLTNYTAGSGANFIVALVDVPASISATQLFAGSFDGTNRFFIGFKTTGQVCAGVGTDSTGTITGVNDLRGQTLVVGLSCDGTTVKLFEADAEVYSASQNGAIPSTVPLRVGAFNAVSVATSFFGGSIAKLVVGREFLTLERYKQIRNEFLA